VIRNLSVRAGPLGELEGRSEVSISDQEPEEQSPERHHGRLPDARRKVRPAQVRHLPRDHHTSQRREGTNMKMIGQPLHFTAAEEWRAWLEDNHASKEEVWLMIYKKHSGKPSVTLEQAVEEAVCFGWIDSQMQPIDAERHAQRFTPRRKTSNWSERNKERAARLIEEGRMTEAGLAKIEEAKRSGRWDKARLL
jgi:hypothetical protein